MFYKKWFPVILMEYTECTQKLAKKSVNSFEDHNNTVLQCSPNLSQRTPCPAHFVCLPNQTHPIQFLQSLLTSWWVESGVLSRAHTVRFLIVFCDCCLSHCTNMIPMSNCRISVVLMSDCTTVKTRQKRTYSRKTCPEFYVINPWPAFSRYNGS